MVNPPLKVLSTYDASRFSKFYAPDGSIPPKPNNFHGKYLEPMLAHNEELRLQVVWEFTARMTEDASLMAFLQDTVDLAREYFKSDTAMIGIMDRDYFTRVAAAGCELGSADRKETICAHMITNPNHTLFIPDLDADWRYARCPAAAASGLKYWAIVPLVYRDDGQEVVIGTLSVGKANPSNNVTTTELNILNYMGQSVMHYIVSCAHKRWKQTEDTFSAAAAVPLDHQSQELNTMVADCVAMIAPMMKDTHVSLHEHRTSSASNYNPLTLPEDVTNTITDNCVKFRDGKLVNLDKFVGGLWVDESVVIGEEYQKGSAPPSKFGSPLFTGETARALAVPVYINGALTYTLLLERENLKGIFSNAEVAFVSSIANRITTAVQHYLIDKSNSAKTQFLSSMSHEMRTPLHGILSASKLLQEENSSAIPQSQSLVHTIESSSKNLLGVVNTLIEFDKLESQQILVQKSGPHSLQTAEQDVLDSITLHDGVVLVCDNQLPYSVNYVRTDQELLKQCLVSVLQNAIYSTERGSVVLRTSVDEQRMLLVYDVIDTSKGISSDLKDKIFLPFTKINPFSVGSGLGLNIGRRVAQALGGDLRLISTEANVGSHFQLRVEYEPAVVPRLDLADFSGLTYHSPIKENLRTKELQYILQGMERVGLTSCNHPEGGQPAAVVVEDTQSLEHVDLRSLLALPSQVLILICEATGKYSDVIADMLYSDIASRVVVCRSPVGRFRMLEAIRKANRISLELMNHKPHREISPLSNSMSLLAIQPLNKSFMREDLRVLIVDDNSANRCVLSMYCKKRKVDFAVAVNGQEAIDKHKKNFHGKPFTLILMDLQMPICDGIQATQTIREFESSYPAFMHSLIFVVTGLSSDQDKLASQEAGADGFYIKPLGLNVLDDMIRFHFKSPTQVQG